MDAKARTKENAASWKAPSPSSRFRRIGGGANGQNNQNDNSTSSHAPDTHLQAIARQYPDTTIFFADIVGFTKWSSSRTPTEVFHLLETIYGAFDKIATRRKVFKVETIGDCYVAVVSTALRFPSKIPRQFSQLFFSYLSQKQKDGAARPTV